MPKKRATATAPELTRPTYFVMRYKTTRWAVYARQGNTDTRVSAPQANKHDAIAIMEKQFKTSEVFETSEV